MSFLKILIVAIGYDERDRPDYDAHHSSGFHHGIGEGRPFITTSASKGGYAGHYPGEYYGGIYGHTGGGGGYEYPVGGYAYGYGHGHGSTGIGHHGGYGGGYKNVSDSYKILRIVKLKFLTVESKE